MALQQIANTDISSTGTFALGSVSSSALTSGRVTFATAGGLLTDSSTLTYDGTTLTSTKFAGALNGTVGATTPSTVVATSVTNSGLTSGRVTFAGASGLLSDSSNLTFNGTTLTANTIGAYTLSGTIAGGGNQINNVIIGNSTPLAGSFTALSATGNLTVTGTTNFGGDITTTLGKFYVVNTYGYYFGGSGNLTGFTGSNGTGTITLSTYGTTRATFDTNGVTLTGTIRSSGTNGNIQILDGNTAGGMKIGSYNAALNANGYLAFEGYSIEYGRFDSSGNFGIGATSLAANLHISKSTTATVMISNISTTLVTDDAMGLIDFSAGSSNTVNARISGLVVGTSEAGGSLAIETRTDGGSLTEKFRITGAGNVGIGTGSPSARLGILATGMNNQIVLGVNPSNANYGSISFNGSNADTSRLGFTGGGSGDNTLYIDVPATTGAYAFRQGVTNVITVNTSGNVGIGTSSPAARLDVTTATAGFAAILTNTNGASDSNGLNIRSGTVSTEYNLRCSNTAGSTDFMVVKGNGNVGIGTSSPGSPLDVVRSSVSTSAFDESVIRAINSGTATLNQRVDVALRFQDGTYNGIGGISMLRESATARSGTLIFSPIDSSGNSLSAMRIDSSGNVGVGVSPSDKLHIENGTLRISGTTAQAIYLYGAAAVKPYITLNEFGVTNNYIGAGSTTSGVLSINGSLASSTGLHVKASNGFVGMGTSSPSYNLQVYNDSDVWHFVAGGETGQVRIGGQPTGGGVIGAYAPNSTPRNLILQRDGANILIAGASEASYVHKLNLLQTSASAGGIQSWCNSASFTGSVITARASRATTNNSYTYFQCSQDGVGDKLYIFDSGNVYNTTGTYGTLSDIKLKENIVDATSKLNDVMALKVRNFNLKSEPELKQIGFIAQELETIFPSMVEETLDQTKIVKTTVLIPILVKAIQEQQALIESMAAKLKDAGVAGF